MPWDQDLDPNSPAYGIASSQARFNRVVAGRRSSCFALCLFLFPRFQLPGERSEARGHRRRETVVLILQTLPDR
jgi:hypothetical protein